MNTKPTCLFAFVFLILSHIGFTQNRRLLIPYRFKNKWGYADTLGHVRIKPVFDSVHLFIDGNFSTGVRPFAVVKKAGFYGVINQQGTFMVPCRLSSFYFGSMDEGMYFLTIINNKVGVYDGSKQIIPPVYDEVHEYPNRSFLVRREGREALINQEGKIIVPFMNGTIEETKVSKGFVYWDVVKKGKHQIIRDKYVPSNLMVMAPAGELINGAQDTQSKPSEVEDLQKQLDSLKKQYDLSGFRVSPYVSPVPLLVGDLFKQTKRGVFIPSFNVLILPKYDNLYWFVPISKIYQSKYPSKLLIVANLDGKAGIIDDKENVVFPFDSVGLVYQDIEHYFKIYKNGKQGAFIPGSPSPSVQAKYDYIDRAVSLPVTATRSFVLLRIKNNAHQDYVGENGVEFFKD